MEAPPPAPRRFRLDLAYDGRPFAGWQSQPGGGSVQDALEAALAATCPEVTTVQGSGRTDAGVSATGQVAHFDTPPYWRMDGGDWLRALNSKRPPTIRVMACREVDPAFHARFSAVEKTYVRFSGERTGYESSLIANDFVPNDDEAVLRVDDSEAQRYYFFRNDRLWKILVAYSSNVSRNTPFPEFLDQVQGKYGRPANVEWVTPKGGVKAIHAAHWDDPTTRLVAEDRTEFFGTYCMKFLSLSEGVALEESRKASGTARKSSAMDDPSVASALSEITADTGASHDDVVDRLTGTQHTIDLVGNRPDNEGRLDRGPVDSPTFPGSDRGPKPKGKAKGKKAAPKAGAAAPATPSKPVIIY
jgi:hypothetical protein